MTVEEWLRQAYIKSHISVIRGLEPYLFPSTGEIGQGLPPVPAQLANRRNPVILIHGYGDLPYGSEDFARSLRRDGWTVYVLETPQGGLGGVKPGVEALKQMVERVRRETGAAKVDLVGHSQGGLISRWYVKFAGGLETVARVVSLSSPHHGLRAWYSPLIDAARGSGLRFVIPHGLEEILVGSKMIRALNAGDETPDGVAWTSIYAQDFDGIVGPAWSPILEGADNVMLTTETRITPRGIARGPHHFLVNHFSLEAYVRLRGALLGLKQGVGAEDARRAIGHDG